MQAPGSCEFGNRSANKDDESMYDELIYDPSMATALQHGT